MRQPNRKRSLKVYGGNLDGLSRVIMAARSIREFSEATKIGRDWICQTGNTEEVAQAMTSPGTVFVRSHNARAGDPWKERR